jgi:hypothetical protein
MIANIAKQSYTGGEWSPSMYGRTDMDQYRSAVRELTNFLIHPHGGISNRPGTKFVVECKDSTKKARLIPFQFSVVQSYVLEFGHNYIRIIKDDGIIVDPATQNIIEITTPYTEDELNTLKYTQSADVLYLAHPNHMPKKLSRIDHHIWKLDDINVSSLKVEVNC